MTTLQIDPFELVRAEELLLGYSARWFDAPLEILAVEQEFDAPLVNPETGYPSTKARLGGKIDALVRHLPTSRVLVVEHKTSSEDLDGGSTYWKRLTLDSQLSTYMVGARALGFEPAGVLYDVVGKPGLRPLAATPIESRKYTKPTMSNPTSRLYANQRENDETLDEYRARVRDAIAEAPERYYVRGDVVRLADDEREAAFDVWQTAANIREGRRIGRWPRNPGACISYGQTCTFWPVCAGEASLDDSTRYRVAARAHEELTNDRASSLPMISNSEISAHRACARLHRYRYDLGYRAVVETEARRFGTLVHLGLESWWRALAERTDETTAVTRALDAMRAARVQTSTAASPTTEAPRYAAVEL